MILELRQEYLARNQEEKEEGEIVSQSIRSKSPQDVRETSPTSRSPSPHRKRKHKKDKDKKSRRSDNSPEHDKPKKKKHRRHRSSSNESRDDDGYRRDSSYRTHKSSRKY